jgi:hypothetical protein
MSRPDENHQTGKLITMLSTAKALMNPTMVLLLIDEFDTAVLHWVSGTWKFQHDSKTANGLIRMLSYENKAGYNPIKSCTPAICFEEPYCFAPAFLI